MYKVNLDYVDEPNLRFSYDGETIFPVTIKDKHGSITKVISSDKLKKKFWRKFYNRENQYNNMFFREKELFNAIS